MIQKKNTQKIYNLPTEVKYCKKCTISNQRPRISFDKDGVCSACNFAVFKRKKIDWKERENELVELCNRFRSSDGSYDVVVPCSGGKDGTFVAHELKFKYNMNPICVTWSPLLKTEIGKENLQNFIDTGFNHILGTPDPVITRRLTRLSFLELGDPFQPFIYGQANFPLHIANCFNVKLIMYGENGEVEYGGDMKNAYIPTRTIKDYSKHYFSGINPDQWVKYNLGFDQMYPFMGPSEVNINSSSLEMHFYGYYKFWDPQENFYFAQKKCNFRVNPDRTEGTYSKYASLDDKLDGFHYYLAYIKFGIGRATSDTAHEIRDDKIDREEGIALVRKYDGEFPEKYFKTFLDYCEITDGEFHDIIDSWRAEHIWEKNGDKWNLKTPIWQS